ncbi:AraC family transcriptional regulator [Pseudomonas sp. ZM23]|uniref:AraC family transcriptional regulator n=1 Tax=Pseudomonas triclosanedens TaxID=2961893 RepID=A0ABY7A479_9PSED|nr:AraC family transcriptional regulator [Pseudomonas triclosanedens]MCP8465797.1 AraC family transcriptional regulator [Pseudomonas triclosanedens]MCP8471292.1 AraC family transcriptional regulator [Pseudomonas triclosanedens]MCP8477096.1 AraC family transcriptional regulator [Pseudomonas triclosanedens]WAI51796.1 AraC family transcriptional regulator [Pseudomonas triclosanedens]
MAIGRFTSPPCHRPGIHAVEAVSEHSFPRHSHDQYGIGLIDRGAQRSLSGRGMVEAGAGWTISVNPGELHDGTPIGEQPRAWRMLYFAPDLLAAALHEAGDRGERHPSLASPALLDPRAEAAFERLYGSLTLARGSAAALAGEEALFDLLRIVGACAPLAASLHTASGLARARALIDDEPGQALTLAHLAEAAELSRFQLLRGFSRAYGLTPHAYLLQRRLELARRLLAEGGTLADVACRCGFADQSHMTRLFRRLYGLSPYRYAVSLR